MPVNSQTKAKYWILTIPQYAFTPYLPPSVAHLAGQLEHSQSNFLHWQLIATFTTQVRLAHVRRVFGDAHAEPTRSDAARAYVRKEETRVDGTEFELGSLPIRRNSSQDWEAVKSAACEGRLDDIPAAIFVQHYRTLRTIRADYSQPIAQVRQVFVFWGPTGVGKSRRVWELAGIGAYPKDPNTKFWDGYRNHSTVVIDEFRGRVDISHLLRWFDRYPVLVEIKGSATPLLAERIYVTSNLDPRCWYPDLDEATQAALMRRLDVTYCPVPLY